MSVLVTLQFSINNLGYEEDSYKSTEYRTEPVYESSSIPYQENTYQPEKPYQDTAQASTYVAEEKYQETTQPTESYYAQMREQESPDEPDDNALMAEIEALEQKLDILQKDIEAYLSE